jgi:hypothetical protein
MGTDRVLQVRLGESFGPPSPFDRRRMRAALAAVEILMLSLSKPKGFGPTSRAVTLHDWEPTT